MKLKIRWGRKQYEHDVHAHTVGECAASFAQVRAIAGSRFTLSAQGRVLGADERMLTWFKSGDKAELVPLN